MHDNYLILLKSDSTSTAKAEAQEFLDKYSDYDSYCGWIDGYEYLDLILGRKTPRKLSEMIDHAIAAQKNSYKAYCNELNSLANKTLKDVINDLNKNPEFRPIYNLEHVLKILDGQFCSSSYIYDYDGGSARITQERLEEIKGHINEYIGVYFDVHS